MTAYFVTATGTDIGKTYVTAGLLRLLKGARASAVKPVVSGFTMAAATASDPGVLLEAMGDAVSAETLDGIAPWRFRDPLSPDMAAAREDRVIDYMALLDFCRAHMARASGPFFIEGVGGVMVPLDARHTVRDWMAALGCPVILIAGTYLGSLSHTLTALDVIARARLRVAAIVLNETRESQVAMEDTVATVARFAGGAPLVPLRRGAPASEFARLWQAIERQGL